MIGSGLDRRLLEVAGRSVVLYQVHYDATSRRALDPRCTPVPNPVAARSLEAAVLGRLLESGEPPDGVAYAGLLSWKFFRKIPIAIDDLLGRLADEGFAADVHAFFGASAARSVWETAEEKHPGILEAAETLLEEVTGSRWRLAELATPIVYQHHFLARPAVLRRYHVELLRPALALLEGGASRRLTRLLTRDSTYRDPRWTRERLREVYGLPHLPLHPFVAERLFPTWLAQQPDLRTNQIWRGRFVERAGVGSEPELAHHEASAGDEG